jgi:hypothetical protein
MCCKAFVSLRSKCTRCKSAGELYRLSRCEWHVWKEGQFIHLRAEIEDQLRQCGWRDNNPDWEPDWDVYY